MKVSRGQVVLVDFPFASGFGQKLRPAVVVQNDANNHRLATTILAPVTSNTKYQFQPTQIPVDPGTALGSQTGLLKPSAIKCENLTTVETRLVRRTIGTMPDTLMAQLETALKASLAIT
jgi:mRNA interferase MazF